MGQSTRRPLAGATILQLVPALRDDPAGHTAMDIARALLQSGARAIVAGEGGPLVGELRAFGGEWLPMPNDTYNPLRIRANARKLANLIAGERIDIVHAHSAGAAWSAIAATRRMPVFLVTSFPDRLAADSRLNRWLGNSLARGDRVIAPSAYVSRAVIERYNIAPDRITVIPRSVDTARFSPAAVSADRIAALRRVWGILPDMRVVLIPGRIARPQHRLRVRRRGPRPGALRTQRAPASGDTQHRYALPHGRPLRRHAGRLRGRRCRGDPGAGAAFGRTRRGRGAGHGPLGGRHDRRRAAGKSALPAAHEG